MSASEWPAEFQDQIGRSVLDRRLPGFIRRAYLDLLEEDPRFAADEAAAIGENLLLTLIGLAMMAYLRCGAPDPQHNQFLLGLFTGTAGRVSTGRLLFQSRRLLESVRPDPFYAAVRAALRDEEVDRANSELIAFRNELMHGIFVAPAERSQAVARLVMHTAGQIFARPELGFGLAEGMDGPIPTAGGVPVSPLFVFVAEDVGPANDGTPAGTDATLSIDLVSHWDFITRDYLSSKDGLVRLRDDLTGAGEFLTLLNDYLREQSGKFLDDARAEARTLASGANVSEHDSRYLLERLGAGNSVHVQGGSGVGKTTAWALAVQQAEQEQRPHISYRMHGRGLRFSASLLLDQLVRFLESRGANPAKKTRQGTPPERAAALLKHSDELNGLAILIDDIHVRQSNPTHVLTIVDELNRLGVRLIGFSPAFPALELHFGNKTALEEIWKRGRRPLAEADLLAAFESFLNDRGPDPEQAESEAQRHELARERDRLWHTVLWLLEKVREADARDEALNLRTMDPEGRDAATIEEAAWVLTPWVFHGRAPFHPDVTTPDPRFVEKESETTFVYRVMRRRDLRLEYLSPVISLRPYDSLARAEGESRPAA